ncbi:AAA family ATPase [Candidatus Roizmanbacteria bacterium]|nr:AAA family ATPase [Candidatus Roizmanbacteria bacterium]
MSLIVLFGLPGTGKTFVGKVFEKYFDYYFYDGDKDLTEEMKKAMKEQKVFTDRMRDVFFQKLTKSIQKLKLKHKKLVVAQTFIKEKYRISFIKKIKDAKFILVETKNFLREKRLARRTDYPLDLEYARIMERNFEKPKIDHLIIINDDDGEDNVKKQIQQFFSQSPSLKSTKFF